MESPTNNAQNILRYFFLAIDTSCMHGVRVGLFLTGKKIIQSMESAADATFLPL